MVDYRLEWILLVGEKSKFMLKGTNDMTVRLPIDYLHAMGKDWVVGEDVEISNAWWDKNGQCYKIQIQLIKKPKTKGRCAK